MDWVPVEYYPNHMEAELGRATLAAAGIESIVSADDAGGMYPQLAVNSGGGIALLVGPENLEEAKVVLNTLADDLPYEPPGS